MVDPRQDSETKALTPDWVSLEREFPRQAIACIRALDEQPGSFSITVRDLAADARASEKDSERLLQRLAGSGYLIVRSYASCGNCGTRLDGAGTDDECPYCQTAFVDTAPSTEIRFERVREPPRDVSWVLVLHGMNTSGTWQEELSWLIGRSYRRMVPVAIYKYGLVRSGVLFGFRQRQILARVIARFLAIVAEAKEAGRDEPPDVIAHSFGSWLIAEALKRDQRIRIGRLILLGAIVRPDFDWKVIVERGQVDLVLNSGAALDRWVRVAEFLIPNTGPGAVRGFHPPVRNVLTPGIGHSGYFAPSARMREMFSTVWEPFLAWGSPPSLPNEVSARSWRSAPPVVRFTTWGLVVGVAAIAVLTATVIAALGTWELASRLIR